MLGSAVVLASSLGLAGCPMAAKLEEDGRFEVLRDASSVPPGCEQALPDAGLFSCDVPAVLQRYCARGGCHGRSFAAANLNLTADTGLIARILDIRATHGGSSCPGLIDCDPSMATCDKCDACPENALLVDRSAPSESWILKKMEPFVPGTTTMNENMHCGDSMPSFFTRREDILTYDASHKQCLTDFFLHIATNTPYPERWPCDLDGGTDGGTAEDGGT